MKTLKFKSKSMLNFIKIINLEIMILIIHKLLKNKRAIKKYQNNNLFDNK